jgi:energy-coupling factor transport system ATP-binding protein
MSALGFERFSYTYPGKDRPALREISVAIEAGEFVVCTGLSASGKSTLLRAASGLVPHFHGGAASGRVVVGGLDTRDHGPGDLARVAGTLLQDPETQVVMQTVGAELAFPLENRGLSRAAVARGVEEIALTLSIAELLERPVEELSGGELQRVALGAALAARPSLVLLDEPTSQLDPVAGDELIWTLRRLNEEWGTAVLLIEHRLERCLAHADRVLVLSDGELVCDAPPSEMLGWAAEHQPALQTPAARLFERAGLRPPPSGVKEARATLQSHGLLDGVAPHDVGEQASPRSRSRWSRRAQPAEQSALSCRGLSFELPDGREVLNNVELSLLPGEQTALMGRNGAGKSTLLRILAGLDDATEGKVESEGRVALLLQNPGDYLIHERVDGEVGADVLADFGLEDLAASHPRDISGGQRQRLALGIVLSGERPSAVLLDEPTRGMDRAAKGDLISRLNALSAAGTAVLVATHDTELAAALAQRVLLLSGGRIVADAPTAEVLSGGWHFATETARVLGGQGQACTPEEGGALLRARMTIEAAP